MLSMMSVEELCRKLKPILGSQIDKLYLKFTLSSDRDTRNEIEQALNALFHKHLQNEMLNDSILLEPPSANIEDGEYPLAKVIYSSKDIAQFNMRENDWIRHMCITGMSGSGKTTFAYQILGSFMYSEKPFLVFDWKQSFRQLLDVDKKILVFTIGNESVRNLFKLNILQPPKNVGPREWINILCDIITESYFASFGVHKLLSETINELFRDFGVYEGSGNYPTFHHIKQRLEDKESNVKGGRGSEWITSAIRIAHSLTFGSFGEVVNYRGNELIDVEELLNQQAIFELDSLNAAEKKFFAELILTYIYKLMKKNYTNTGGKFKYAILVDEAHNIFLKDRPNFLKETITEMIYREIREYGISLICLDQHISKLSEVVAGNSACNIAFQQMLPQDIETIANLMQLRDNRQYFSMLKVGQGIVKLAERYHRPFLIQAPNIHISRGNYTDKDIETTMIERIKQLKRIKIFYKSCNNENLKQNLNRIDSIFHATGVETTEDGIRQFVNSIEEPKIVDNHADDKDVSAAEPKKPAKIVNHLQLELVEIINKLIQTERMEFKDIREYLIKYGHNKQDVNVALQYAYSSKNLHKVEKQKEAQKQMQNSDREEIDEKEEESQYYADLQKRIAKYILSKLDTGSKITEISKILINLGHRKEDVSCAIEMIVSENKSKAEKQVVEDKVIEEVSREEVVEEKVESVKEELKVVEEAPVEEIEEIPVEKEEVIEEELVKEEVVEEEPTEEISKKETKIIEDSLKEEVAVEEKTEVKEESPIKEKAETIEEIPQKGVIEKTSIEDKVKVVEEVSREEAVEEKVEVVEDTVKEETAEVQAETLETIKKADNQESNNKSHSLIKKLKQIHWEYLYAIRDKDFSVTQLNSFLGLSGRKGNNLKTELEQLGLIKVVEERSSKGWKKRISLTELGSSCLSTTGKA